MTVYAITDTKKGRTGIAPTYLQTTPYRRMCKKSISLIEVLEVCKLAANTVAAGSLFQSDTPRTFATHADT